MDLFSVAGVVLKNHLRIISKLLNDSIHGGVHLHV